MPFLRNQLSVYAHRHIQQVTLLNYPVALKDGNTIAEFDYLSTNMISKDELNSVSIWWDKIAGNTTLGAILETGTTATNNVYKIVNTQPNHFFAGCAVGDTFVATGAFVLDANNRVQKYAGSHLAQSVVSKRPTWSKDGILFDGVSESMSAVSASIGQPIFIYMLVKQVSWAADRYLFDCGGSLSCRQNSASPTLRVVAGVGANITDFPVGEYKVLRLLFNGANSKAIINENNPSALTLGSGTFNGLNLAMSANAGFGNIQVKNIIIRKVVDSPEDEAKIYKYLKSKLQANPSVYCPSFESVLYEGGTAADVSQISNAAILGNGEMLLSRGQRIYKRTASGIETEVLNIVGARNYNSIFVSKKGTALTSPHASFAWTGDVLSPANRGIYRKSTNDANFAQVLSWYDGSTNDDDVIWTFAEDSKGYLYAGVYSHTVRDRAVLYKSTNDGTTWTEVYNFTAHDANTDHIHCLYYDKYSDALYVALGDGSATPVARSKDEGVTWTQVCTGITQITAITSTPTHRIFGTDIPYACKIYTTSDDVNFTVRHDSWYQNVFGFRVSDKSGYLYAWTMVEQSDVANYNFPSLEAVTNPSVLAEWVAGSHNPEWDAYYARFSTESPTNAIKPSQATILRSKDGGLTWSVIYTFSTSLANGMWYASNFKNGELLIDRSDYVAGVSKTFIRPIVISEKSVKTINELGKVDLTGDAIVKTTGSNFVDEL